MADTSRSLHVRGLALSATGVVVLSPDALFLRLVRDAGLWDVIFYRMLFLGCALAVGLGLYYRARLVEVVRGMGRADLLSAVLLAASNVGFVGAISHTTVTNALVILAATPLFSAVLGRVFIGETVPLRTWVAILVAIAGVGIVFRGSIGGGNWLGDAMALSVAFVWGLNLVVLRKAGRRDMTPALCLSGFLAALAVLPLATPVSVSAQDLAVLAILGCGILPVAFCLFFRGTRYMPAAEVALLALIETVLGPIWAWLGVGEVPSGAAIIGGAVVVAAIVGNSLLAMRGSARPP